MSSPEFVDWRDIKLHYIVHPITTGEKSVKDSLQIIKQIVASYANMGEVVPVASSIMLADVCSVAGCQLEAYAKAQRLLAVCDCVMVYGEWWTSKGCLAEIVLARALGKAVFIQHCYPWENVSCR